jgi:amidohydrolase
MNLQQQILTLAHRYLPDAIARRRHLHQHPELSYQEVLTGRWVAQQLTDLGVEHVHGVADNGVVALVKGRNPDKKVVALRADFDALPIQEANDVPYRSQNPGVMHACGHDVHTASLLGTVRILHELSDHWEGTVKCLFQPAEEQLPGGASLMIRDGALENPRPAGIFGQHVHPPLRAGKVGFRPGIYMASSDELYLTVRGRGGHGATPHETVDPILLASHIVVALQQVVSRRADPTLPTVLTLGKINSVGGATNVIPDEVRLEGTFRTMNETWRAQAHQHLRSIAENVALAMGGTCDLEIRHGYPVLHNDEALTRRARDWAVELLGPDRVVDLPIRLTAEDFAYYSQVLPACFYRLGTGNPERGITSALHTPTFDVDEAALETGMALMAWLAVKELDD